MYFLKKYRDRIVITLITILLLVIIGNTSTERESITRIEKMVGNVLTPVSKVTNGLGQNISSFFSSMFDFVNVKEENDNLKLQLMVLESEKRDLENIIGKSDYLKNELEMQKNSQHNILASEIISKEPGNWYNRFTIDKGSNDGIKKDSTVIQGIEVENNVYQEGIVGRVIDVGDNWAKVITIIDELNSISFKILRTQDGGVLSGNLDGSVRSVQGYLFDNKADVIVGDKLYTSGLGGSYKKDIYIGEVSEVISDDNELTKRIKINPALNFKKLYKVFVIIE